MNYGKALRTARATRNMSQRQLAQVVDVDPSYLSLVEKGARTPSTAMLEKLARGLNLPMYLLVLLASEGDDLKALPEEEAGKLASSLLGALVSAEEEVR